jgi:hydroxypyruvate isomerase
LLERIDAAGRAGFKAVELHAPYDVPAAETRAVCARHGLTLLGINTANGSIPGNNGLAAIAGYEAEFQALVDQSIAYVREAGGTSVHALAGIVSAADRERASHVIVENLRIAAAKAAPHGLTILLEALNPRSNPGYFYSEIESVLAIIARVGAPNVKLMFDVFHVGVAQGDVLTRLRTNFDRIGHVQIAAVPSRAEPDEGEIAYGAIFHALEELGYDGWVGCEYRPRGDTDAGLVWMQKLGVAL